MQRATDRDRPPPPALGVVAMFFGMTLCAAAFGFWAWVGYRVFRSLDATFPFAG